MSMTPEEIDSIRRTIADLRHLIEGGDPDTHPGVLGLVRLNADRLKQIEKRQDDTERTIDRMKWVVVGWATGGALAGGGIVAALLETGATP